MCLCFSLIYSLNRSGKVSYLTFCFAGMIFELCRTEIGLDNSNISAVGLAG